MNTGTLKPCSLIIDIKLDEFSSQHFSSKSATGQETSSDYFKATKLETGSQENLQLFPVFWYRTYPISTIW